MPRPRRTPRTRLLLAAATAILLGASCRSRSDAPGDSGGAATGDGGAGAGIGSAASNAQVEAQRPRADTLPDGRPTNGTADTPTSAACGGRDRGAGERTEALGSGRGPLSVV